MSEKVARPRYAGERANKSAARHRVVSAPGHIYAALSHDEAWIKLGFSTLIADRLVAINHDLKTYAPFKLIGTTRSTYRVEQQLHKSLAPFQQGRKAHSREMYPKTPSLLLVIEAVVARPDMPLIDIDDLLDLRRWVRAAAKLPLNRVPAHAAYDAMEERRRIWWEEFQARLAAERAAA